MKVNATSPMFKGGAISISRKNNPVRELLYNEVIDFNLEDIQISKDVDAYNTSIDLSSYVKYNFDNNLFS